MAIVMVASTTALATDWLPVACCDSCFQPLAAGGGTVLFPADAGGQPVPTASQPFFVDSPECGAVLKRRLTAVVAWIAQDLDVFLALLALSSRCNVTDAQQRLAPPAPSDTAEPATEDPAATVGPIHTNGVLRAALEAETDA